MRNTEIIFCFLTVFIILALSPNGYCSQCFCYTRFSEISELKCFEGKLDYNNTHFDVKSDDLRNYSISFIRRANIYFNGNINRMWVLMDNVFQWMIPDELIKKMKIWKNERPIIGPISWTLIIVFFVLNWIGKIVTVFVLLFYLIKFVRKNISKKKQI